MSGEHSLKKRCSLNETFKSYEPTCACITPKTHKKVKKWLQKYTSFFYKKVFGEAMRLKNSKNFKKMVRKSPVWNVSAAIFKNADFS